MSTIIAGTIFFIILWVVAALIIGEYVASSTTDVRERLGNKQYFINK